MRKVLLFTMVIIATSLSLVFAEEYHPTRWDKIAKRVHFTVPQENQIKILLTGERQKIMEARGKAAEKILKILKPEQRKKWDKLYTKADKKEGYVGNLQKRMLLNPAFLEQNFKLTPHQRQTIFYIAWDYAREVSKIRSKTFFKIKNLLMKKQYEEWISFLNKKIAQEEKKKEKIEQKMVQQEEE